MSIQAKPLHAVGVQLNEGILRTKVLRPDVH